MFLSIYKCVSLGQLMPLVEKGYLEGLYLCGVNSDKQFKTVKLWL